MTYRCFKLDVADGVAHLVLDRPQAMNTMQPVFWRELEQIAAMLHKDAPARALVISSTGKHFTAGMALDVFRAGTPVLQEADAASRANIREELLDMMRAFNALEELRMPVIAAIHGGCVGGGLDMVAACDVRLATDDAFFCIQEINIGLTADLGSLQRLPKLLPDGLVRELAYTGRRLSAKRALALGFVNELFPTTFALEAAAMEMAREIAEKPPVAVWGSKQAINYARDHTVAEALQQMAWLQSGIWQTGNLVESFTAKQAGRAPKFDDLHPVRRFAERDYDLK